MRKLAKIAILTLGIFLLSATAMILWPTKSAPLPAQRNSIVIENIRIVDPVSETTSQPVSVVVRNGLITEIARNVHSSNLRRIDGQGAYAIAGMWDMHVHTFQSSPQMHLPLWIANGVTNVRDMMGCPGFEDSLIACAKDKREWNRQVEIGALAAPRIVGMASYYFEDPDLTPSQAASRVGVYSDHGVDAIKVYNRLSPSAYRALAAETQRRGLRLVGHLPKAVSLLEALDAGQTSFEHAHLFTRHCFDRSDAWRDGKLEGLTKTEQAEQFVRGHEPARCETAFAAMASAGAWYVPTHVTREEDARAGEPEFIEAPMLGYLDPLSRFAYNDDLSGTLASYPGKRGAAALQAYFEHGLRLTGEAHRSGVKVLVGTDGPLGGFRYHDELSHLVAAGLTNAEVLRAATIDAARYAGEVDTSGSIEIGKRADIVLLSGNPLQDIANTRRIRAVLHGGRLYDRERLDALLHFVSGQADAPHNWAKLVWGYARSSIRSDL